MSDRIDLTVVVGLISGEPDDLRRCLQALHAQTIPLEVVVPYDDPCRAVVELAREFPGVRFVHAEGLDTWRARAGSSREHHDSLRTIGLRTAGTEFVLLTEDHAHAASTWATELVAALERNPGAGAVGGAVECDSTRALNWAVWFCDFGRYQNPLPEGPAWFVSDSNVLYRRSALERVADAWRDDYHETAVHGAMGAAGLELRTTPRAVVWQAREHLTASMALRERFVWGRSYAGTRARLVGAKRWMLAAMSPALPLLLTSRLASTTFARGRHTGRFVRCLPHILLLQSVWALGELVGYATADPG